MNDSDVCTWCGATYGNHVYLKDRKPTDPVPKCPCTGLKEYFLLEVPFEKKEVMFRVWSREELTYILLDIVSSAWIQAEEESKSRPTEVFRVDFFTRFENELIGMGVIECETCKAGTCKRDHSKKIDDQYFPYGRPKIEGKGGAQ